jgi:hypothetical protein
MGELQLLLCSSVMQCFIAQPLMHFMWRVVGLFDDVLPAVVKSNCCTRARCPQLAGYHSFCAQHVCMLTHPAALLQQQQQGHIKPSRPYTVCIGGTACTFLMHSCIARHVLCCSRADSPVVCPLCLCLQFPRQEGVEA